MQPLAVAAGDEQAMAEKAAAELLEEYKEVKAKLAAAQRELESERRRTLTEVEILREGRAADKAKLCELTRRLRHCSCGGASTAALSSRAPSHGDCGSSSSNGGGGRAKLFDLVLLPNAVCTSFPLEPGAVAHDLMPRKYPLQLFLVEGAGGGHSICNRSPGPALVTVSPCDAQPVEFSVPPLHEVRVHVALTIADASVVTQLEVIQAP
ncbi:hypothetical protein DIPPA_35247 [Diplonema papillatum]|nr:hypothetical protein DIPPA_35247 [Diplonema papillatum]